MPLRPLGSVLTLRAACPGGISPHCGLPDRMRSANPGAHLANWPGSSIPIGYKDAGFSMAQRGRALAATEYQFIASSASAAVRCLSRATAAGVGLASAVLDVARLRWRRATGAAGATGASQPKNLCRIRVIGQIGASPSATDIAYAVFTAANAVAPGWSFGRLMRGIGATHLGKKSGSTFRDLNDTTDQVVGTTTPGGDRTAVTVAP